MKRSKKSITNKSRLGEPWGIILAGGDGNRLQQFVNRMYGYNRPKQFCTIIGSRSLIRHTRDRALMLIPKHRLITVTNLNQIIYAAEEIGDQPYDTFVIQPSNKDTAAGILLPLLKIQEKNPNAIVTIFPSDHFIYDETRFMEYVTEANNFVINNKEFIVLLGVKPDKAEAGYGWIEIGSSLLIGKTKYFYKIDRFWEKPSIEKTYELYFKKCLWNTFVLVGHCDTIIEQVENCLPSLVKAVEPIKKAFGTKEEQRAINSIFQSIPAINFSSAVLQNIPNKLVVMQIDDVYWSDWGEEKRIYYDAAKFDLQLKLHSKPSKRSLHITLDRDIYPLPCNHDKSYIQHHN